VTALEKVRNNFFSLHTVTMPNRLSHEKSPYLLQHANNPVDWYPWGAEAFAKAQREHKPIFLSIGYSTCHWCHVMERESFEDRTIAELMNEHFVSIKVDREERPDIDRVYMAAVQTMTGSGGWPMSVFLTPDLKPFYGGTYYPPTDMYGKPGFPTVLAGIRQFWDDEHDKIEESGDQLLEAIREQDDATEAQIEPHEALLHAAYDTIAASYDEEHGGFGHGAKFPRPVVFRFLFQYYTRTGNENALRIALTTLMAMASGGMYDHLGGGFHRYSVDPRWRVPHFEKMLYDQAQLVRVYCDAYEITRDEFFARVARETIEYVLRDLTDASGGFFSAEDADSREQHASANAADDANRHEQHASDAVVEGAFYVWTKQEIDEVLTPAESQIFCEYYSVAAEGNVESDPRGEFTLKNILFAPQTLAEAAAHCAMSVDEAAVHLASAKGKVFSARASRPRPLRDDKIIAGWNGLMIGALAHASVVLNDAALLDRAVKAADWCMSSLYDRERKTLRRRYRDGEASLEAHLDDYACMADGALELYDATSDTRWLDVARELTGTQEALFWDAARGGFYETSGKDPSVLVRMKEMYDGAEPAGNSVSAGVLVRLSRSSGIIRHQTLARSTLRSCCTKIQKFPHMMPLLMCAVDAWLSAPENACADGSCAIDER
jgi:uncharacterized protein